MPMFLLSTLPKKGKACVYFVVRDSEVIYVGRTGHIARRINQHAKKEPQRIYIIECISFGEAIRLEQRMIWLFAPKLNVDSEKLTENVATVKELESWNLDRVSMHIVRGIVRITDVIQYGIPHR